MTDTVCTPRLLRIVRRNLARLHLVRPVLVRPVLVRPVLVVTVLGLLAALPVRAQTAAGDSLREDVAVRRVLDASPEARAARARLAAARAAAALEQRALVEAPEADLSTTLGPSLVPEEDDRSTEATVSVALERPAVRRARRAAARATLDAATAEARVTLDALVFEVRAAVATLAADEALVRLAAIRLADADTLAGAVALRFRVGDASELDLRLARIDAARAAADADEATGQAAEARARLAGLLGVAAADLPPLAQTPYAPPPYAPPPDSAAAPPVLAAAEAAARAAEAEAQSARARTRLPTFTLHGGIGHSRLFFGPDDLDADPALRDGFRRLGRAGVDVLVGVSFPLPFGSPARRVAALAEAEAAARVAESSAVAAGLARDAEAARLRLERAEAAQARYRAAQTDVAESLSLLQLAYAGGEIGLEDLIAGRARLYDTLAAGLRADADAALARLARARALGTVSAGLRLDP